LFYTRVCVPVVSCLVLPRLSLDVPAGLPHPSLLKPGREGHCRRCAAGFKPNQNTAKTRSSLRPFQGFVSRSGNSEAVIEIRPFCSPESGHVENPCPCGGAAEQQKPFDSWLVADSVKLATHGVAVRLLQNEQNRALANRQICNHAAAPAQASSWLTSSPSRSLSTTGSQLRRR
jgi:hypothetical protein